MIIAGEDRKADVIRPRLDAADADPRYVHIFDQTFDLSDRPALESLIDKAEAALRKAGQELQLVIVDGSDK